MTNTKKNIVEEEAPLHVILFCSRNKDNSDIEGFEQRNRQFLSRSNIDDLKERFGEFVRSGKSGEMCRLYISVNARNNEKIHRELLHWMIDNPNQNMAHIESRTVSIAARSECAAEKKWMFDFDMEPTLIGEFVNDIHKCDAEVDVDAFPTPNGLCVITSRGFDIRKLDLLDKWKGVELKKDALRCVVWKTNK